MRLTLGPNFTFPYSLRQYTTVFVVVDLFERVLLPVSQPELKVPKHYALRPPVTPWPSALRQTMVDAKKAQRGCMIQGGVLEFSQLSALAETGTALKHRGESLAV